MDRLNDIFENVYVLTYEGSSNYNSIKERYKDLDYNLIIGYNKKDIDLLELSQLGYTGYGDALNYTVENFACTFGHIKIYNDMKSKGLKKALILEDDNYIIEKNIPYFIKAYNELPEDWDIFYGGSSNHNRINIFYNNYKNFLFKGQVVIEGTNFYAINNNFIEIALEKQNDPKKMNPIADALIWNIKEKLNMYSSSIQIACQINDLLYNVALRDNDFIDYINEITLNDERRII